MGELTTPRTPVEKLGDKVIARDGADVTEEFEKGADRTLKIAQLVGSEVAILKARSPSCGKGLIYDGSHTGSLTEGNGITADLLIQNSIKVLTEEEI